MLDGMPPYSNETPKLGCTPMLIILFVAVLLAGSGMIFVMYLAMKGT